MVSWETYFDRLTSVHIQFAFARKAMTGFAMSAEATDAYAKSELESLRGTLEKARKKGQLEGHWAYTDEGSQKYLEQIRAGIPDEMKKVSNRLNQNELILRVSLLESFLKDIHREVLRQAPALLRADRQIPLGRIVSGGIDAVISEEIDREVHALDRKSIEDRSRYFEEVLGVGWKSLKMDKVLEKISAVRNRISHEDPDAEVSDEFVKYAGLVGFIVPWTALIRAAARYPSGFELPKSMTLEDAKKFADLSEKDV